MMIHKIGTTARVWTSFFLNRIHLAIFCFLQERRNKTFLYCVKKNNKIIRKLVPSPSSSCSAIWSPEESSNFQREVTVRTVFARPRSGSRRHGSPACCSWLPAIFTRFSKHLPSQPRAPRHRARNHSNTGCKGCAWSQHSFVLCKARDDVFLSFLSVMKAWLMGGKCCSLVSFPRTVGMHMQILYISSDTFESRVLGTSGLERHWDEWRAAGNFPTNT